MTDLNLTGESHAHSLIAAGKVDRESDWSFTASDGNALLGSGGDDWAAYGEMHLGLDRGAAADTKARYKYPYGKGGKAYRSGVIAAKQRAAQTGDTAIEGAALRLLAEIDKNKSADELSAAYVGVGERVKAMLGEVKQVSDRTLGFTISTNSVDRMGDTIAVDGWKLGNYQRNPVVLWAHDSTSLPVGKAANVRVEGNSLKADVNFTPAGQVPFNDTVLELYKGGFLNATSVGFAPIKYAFSDEPARGIDFIEQELLEFSLVPIPANPEALMLGKRAGIKTELLVDWCLGQITDDELEQIVSRRFAQRGDMFARRAVVTLDEARKAERLANAKAKAARKLLRELDLVKRRSA